MTPQFLIRAAEPSDAPALQALFSLPEVYPQTSLMPYPDVALWQKKVADRAESWQSLVAEIDGELVGQVTLHPEAKIRRRHVASIGLAVHPAFSGRGIGRRLMTEAIMLCERWLNVQRIELIVYVNNEVAVALYQKLGFVIEGTLKGYGFGDGAYQDVYFMARCRWPDASSATPNPE
ncbi:MAG: GNAT family N-acetyltransferase [Neisseriaceae bacterium]|nr:GNAT family N-acetyltransferase [Neisseriaceae bacterium]